MRIFKHGANYEIVVWFTEWTVARSALMNFKAAPGLLLNGSRFWRRVSPQLPARG